MIGETLAMYFLISRDRKSVLFRFLLNRTCHQHWPFDVHLQTRAFHSMQLGIRDELQQQRDITLFFISLVLVTFERAKLSNFVPAKYVHTIAHSSGECFRPTSASLVQRQGFNVVGAAEHRGLLNPIGRGSTPLLGEYILIPQMEQIELQSFSFRHQVIPMLIFCKRMYGRLNNS